MDCRKLFMLDSYSWLPTTKLSSLFISIGLIFLIKVKVIYGLFLFELINIIDIVYLKLFLIIGPQFFQIRSLWPALGLFYLSFFLLIFIVSLQVRNELTHFLLSLPSLGHNCFEVFWIIVTILKHRPKSFFYFLIPTIQESRKFIKNLRQLLNWIKRLKSYFCIIDNFSDDSRFSGRLAPKNNFFTLLIHFICHFWYEGRVQLCLCSYCIIKVLFSLEIISSNISQS